MMYDPKAWFWLVGAAQEIYSSAAAGFVTADDSAYASFIASGNLPTRIASQDDLVDVLRAANVPPYHLVPTRTVVDRLQAAGKLTAARAALDGAALYLRERWNTRTEIFADDQDALALLQAIGADAEVILAPVS